MVVLHEGCVVYRKLFGVVNVIHPEIIYVHVCQECLKIVYKVQYKQFCAMMIESGINLSFDKDNNLHLLDHEVLMHTENLAAECSALDGKINEYIFLVHRLFAFLKI